MGNGSQKLPGGTAEIGSDFSVPNWVLKPEKSLPLNYLQREKISNLTHHLEPAEIYLNK